MQYHNFDKLKNQIITYLKSRELFHDTDVMQSVMADRCLGVLKIKQHLRPDMVMSYMTLHNILYQIICFDFNLKYIIQDNISQIEYPTHKEVIILNLELFLTEQTDRELEFNTIVNNEPVVRKISDFTLKISRNFLVSPVWMNFKEFIDKMTHRPSSFPYSLYNEAYSAQNEENIRKESLYQFICTNKRILEKKNGCSINNISKEQFLSSVKSLSFGKEEYTDQLIKEVWSVISAKNKRKDKNAFNISGEHINYPSSLK